MNNLLNPTGYIKYAHFLCLTTNKEYRITSSTNNGTSVFTTLDLVKCITDNLSKEFTRLELQKRFTNVQEIKTLPKPT